MYSPESLPCLTSSLRIHKGKDKGAEGVCQDEEDLGVDISFWLGNTITGRLT